MQRDDDDDQLGGSRTRDTYSHDSSPNDPAGVQKDILGKIPRNVSTRGGKTEPLPKDTGNKED